MPILTPPVSPPASNVIQSARSTSRARGTSRATELRRAYDSGFVGAFLNNPKDANGKPDSGAQPTWARDIANHYRGEFLRNTPGKLKKYSDIASTLKDDGKGKTWANFRHALELWERGGRVGPMPYTEFQDFGSCVNASKAAGTTMLLGIRAADPANKEIFSRSAAWYEYGNRGYCSDGWYMGAQVAISMQVGLAFRRAYSLGGLNVDFTDDDTNEYYVARGCCRAGLPDALERDTAEHHPYEDGAFVEFDGDRGDLLKVFAAKGGINTGGVYTSGGSKPFTPGRVGGHEQFGYGADDSEECRKWFRDLGITIPADDFPIAMDQTWGPGFSGACAAKYWPTHLWGPQPEGCWLALASQIIRNFAGDIWACFPKFKGVADPNPAPVPPPGPVAAPPLSGSFRIENGVIRGTAGLVLPVAMAGSWSWKIVPDPLNPGQFIFAPKLPS